ncbi:MAG: glycosyltransferase family 4 protein [Chloroflexi bacterium]|nr:glycosyltransferase family 4 protein [Chloroflexota bacterium]
MTLAPRRLSVDILVNAVRSSEATGDHTIALARALVRQAVTVRIFSNAVGALPADIQIITQQIDAAAYPGGADLLIVQYGIWHPLAELLRSTKTPALFWYHGVTPPELWSNAPDRAVLHNARQRTNLVWQTRLAVCTSAFTKTELQQLTGYPEERLVIVPLGIDVTAFATPLASQQITALRNKWQLTGKRVLLYVGRIAEHKRIDLLIAALGHLHKDFPTLHLLIVGDIAATTATRDFHKQLQAQAIHLGVASAVTFTGRVETVIPYYHLAEIYAQPSQHEGFCVPLGEAMAAGTPVIASRSGAMPWVLNADVAPAQAAGALFTPGDSADLARQIERLLAEPSWRATLIARGKARVEAFTLAQFDQNVQQVLAAALAWSQQPPPVAPYQDNALATSADVALRGYRVQSKVPGLGRLIEWLRTNSTSHLKAGYLDRIIEQQVNYNRLLAQEIDGLHQELADIKQQIGKLTEDHED